MSQPIALTLAFAALACGADAPPSEAESPPNLVLVIGDDHGYTDFGFMGSQQVQTPHLDALAAEGVTFPVGYSTSSVCRPALRTLLTGLEPAQYALREFAAPELRGAALVRELETLPRLLTERGYASFQAGKHMEGHFEAAGFDEGMVEHPGDRGLKEGKRLVRETLDPALDFVSRNAERPFFLWFAPVLPHVPHDPPERWLDAYDDPSLRIGARRYYASVSWFDEAVGRLVDHIDGLGLGRRTLVVYLADNGWDAQPPESERNALLGGPRGKKSLYELGFRTPILLRWQDRLAPAERAELVSIADLFPTLLDYGGVQTPSDRRGHSLRALLEEGVPWPRTALIGSTHVLRSDARGHKGGFFWRDARWHYLESTQAGIELYDLDADPSETQNVAKQHPDVLARARAEIRAWSREIAAERPKPTKQRASRPRLAVAPPKQFPSPVPVRGAQAFDVVASDADLDGDPDLLVNWHHQGPLELLENRGGRFVPFDVDLDAGLYADADEMGRRIRAREGVGLYLWHDVDRGGRWRFLWRNPEASHPLELELEASLGFLANEGLEDPEIEQRGTRSLTVRLAAGVRERAFSLQTLRIAVRLAVRRDPALPLFIGSSFTPAAQAEVELWKGDPHGVAWVDLVDTPLPELFVARGALGGELVPPAAAKRDRLLLPVPVPAPGSWRDSGGVPADYRSARRVEAVDVDGDGRLELWVGARDGPNRLLVREGSEPRFADRAAGFGLEQEGGAVGSWGDFDGDGAADLYLIEDGALVLLQSDGAGGFVRVAGETLGVELPEVPPRKGLFLGSRLRLADLDRDGDLDLLLLSHGARNAVRLYRRDGDRFVDATAALGVGAAKGGRVALVVDLDRDGYPDLVHLGTAPAIWHNREGARFELLPLPSEAVPRGLAAATVLDADGDGALDVLAVGRTRRLLWNRTQTANRTLEIVLPARGVGAQVTAHYADGSAQAQRFGSEHSTSYSQALQPLRFGMGPGDAIERVTVRWPGTRAERSHPVGPGTRLELEAPPPAAR